MASEDKLLESYDLWRDSQYYKSEILSAVFENNNYWISAPNLADDEVLEAKNKRRVTREALYEDPDKFYCREEFQENYEFDDENILNSMQELRLNDFGLDPIQPTHVFNPMQGSNEIAAVGYIKPPHVKSLYQPDRAAARPVLTSTYDMLQNEYRQNQAIVEWPRPFEPARDANVKTSKLTKKELRRINNYAEDYFTTNLLLHICEFVKSEFENEIMIFRLFKEDKRRVRGIVKDIQRAGREVAMDLNSVRQMEIVNEILERNQYVICSRNIGKSAKGYVSIYKSAPDYMYLITPPDLRTEYEKEDTNPFLQSIEKHIEPSYKPRPRPIINTPELTIEQKLEEYFTEFAKGDYTEMRFLGAFSRAEVVKITAFLNLISAYSNSEIVVGDTGNLFEIFKSRIASFEVTEDINTNIVINKHPYDPNRHIEHCEYFNDMTK